MKRCLVVLLSWMYVCSLPVTAFAAEYLYITEDTQARRFSDTETPVSGEVGAGARVEVVYRLDSWIRVRLPGMAGFGWVPADKTTTEAPENAGEGSEPPPPGAGTLTPEQRKQLEDALKNLGR